MMGPCRQKEMPAFALPDSHLVVDQRTPASSWSQIIVLCIFGRLVMIPALQLLPLERPNLVCSSCIRDVVCLLERAPRICNQIPWILTCCAVSR